jgi:hypothetical protein
MTRPHKSNIAAQMDAIAEVLDALLPATKAAGSDAAATWIMTVALPALNELQTIVRSQTPRRKARVIIRLLAIDRDDVGVADLIVQDELVDLETCAAALRDADEEAVAHPAYALLRSRVFLAFQWIALVARENAQQKNGSTRSRPPQVRWPEASLARAILAVVAADHVSLDLEDDSSKDSDMDEPIYLAARTLRPYDPLLQFALAIVLVGDTHSQDGGSSMRRAAGLLKGMPSDAEPDPPTCTT